MLTFQIECKQTFTKKYFCEIKSKLMPWCMMTPLGSKAITFTKAKHYSDSISAFLKNSPRGFIQERFRKNLLRRCKIRNCKFEDKSGTDHFVVAVGVVADGCVGNTTPTGWVGLEPGYVCYARCFFMSQVSVRVFVALQYWKKMEDNLRIKFLSQ